MYNPTRFQNTDKQEILQFTYSNPFATLISCINNEMQVSHLPLTPIKTEAGFELYGHMAKANSQWKNIDQTQVTAIFHGPHTYITPKWYQKNDVPTWNYIVCHAIGKIKIFNTEVELEHCLRLLTDHVENLWPSGWQYFVPNDLSGTQKTKHIVGFKISVENFNYKKKLSQNRTPEDFDGILKGLQGRTDETSLKILDEMKRLK